MSRVNTIFFSPTKTTEMIVKKITEGMAIDEVRETNITAYKESYSFPDSDITIIGLPVYSGRIPELVNSRVLNLKGKKTPAIAVVVYGNRDFDDALIEICDILEEKGFNIISAAAFIGEHSYSDKTYPIAANRPDSMDLEKALNYGREISEIIKKGDFNKPLIPGNRPYKERSKAPAFAPVTDSEKCSNCLFCIDLCPTDAIDRQNPCVSDPEKCIRCAACVKACPEGAKKFDNEGILNAAKKLNSLCSQRKEPSIFI